MKYITDAGTITSNVLEVATNPNIKNLTHEYLRMDDQEFISVGQKLTYGIVPTALVSDEPCTPEAAEHVIAWLDANFQRLSQTSRSRSSSQSRGGGNSQ